MNVINTDQATRKVVKHLSELIIHHMSCYQAESHHPRNSADEMDAYLKHHQQAYLDLTKMRSDFEALRTRTDAA